MNLVYDVPLWSVFNKIVHKLETQNGFPCPMQWFLKRIIVAVNVQFGYFMKFNHNLKEKNHYVTCKPYTYPQCPGQPACQNCTFCLASPLQEAVLLEQGLSKLLQAMIFSSSRI